MSTDTKPSEAARALMALRDAALGDNNRSLAAYSDRALARIIAEDAAAGEAQPAQGSACFCPSCFVVATKCDEDGLCLSCGSTVCDWKELIDFVLADPNVQQRCDECNGAIASREQPSPAVAPPFQTSALFDARQAQAHAMAEAMQPAPAALPPLPKLSLPDEFGNVPYAAHCAVYNALEAERAARLRERGRAGSDRIR